MKKGGKCGVDNDRDMRKLVIRSYLQSCPVPGTTTITGPVDIWSKAVPGPPLLSIDYSLFIQTFLLFRAELSFFTTYGKLLGVKLRASFYIIPRISTYFLFDFLSGNA